MKCGDVSEAAKCVYLKLKLHSMVTLTDNSLMPFGKYKGVRLANVPAGYLLFLQDHKDWNNNTPLGRYITANLDVLKEQKCREDMLNR
jgi:uncharacterized protein (DUF3820 family)